MRNVFFILAILVAIPFSPVFAQSKIADNKNISGSVMDAVTKSTPAFVNNFIGSTIKILETARLEAASFSDKNILVVQKQITTADPKTGLLMKSLKYLELYLLIFLSFVFKTVVVFYLCLAFALFYILRFIWRLIF